MISTSPNISGIQEYNQSIIYSYKQITDDSTSKRFPEIYGDSIVWKSVELGHDNIHYLNLNTFDWRNYYIPVGMGVDRPFISHGNLVWTRGSDLEKNDSGGVMVINITLRSERFLPNIWASSIFDNKLAYIILDNKTSIDLYVYDLITNDTITISNQPEGQSYSDIYESNIVWMDSGKGDYLDIYIRNLTSGQERRITNDTSQPERPHIWGDWVIWADLMGRQQNYSFGDPSLVPRDLMGYNIRQNRTSILASSIMTFWRPNTPRISENNVAWINNDNQSFAIYNLTTSHIHYIQLGEQFKPVEFSISGNRIVFISNDNVYILDFQMISNPSPTPNDHDDFSLQLLIAIPIEDFE
jgi:beta propeller repeat protein